jgi:hypothetical protein
MPATGAALPDLHEHAASWWQWAALVALALVYLVSLFRQGVRGFVGQVIAPHTHGHGAEEDACCDHEHAHGHAH